MQDFVPTNRPLAVPLQNARQPAIEIRLERGVVLQLVGAHEGANPSIGTPLRAFDFVAPDVPVPIGEQPRHLAEEAFDELIGPGARRIEGWCEDSEMALDCKRAGPR